MKNILLPAVLSFFGLGLCAQTMLSFPVNILDGLQNSQITATHSPLDIGTIENAFDGNLENVARSGGTNPMRVTLQFAYPISLTATSLNNNSESVLWTVEAAQSLADLDSRTGSYQKLVDAAAHSGFGTSVQNVAASGKLLRLTVQKMCCDNFVHLEEWGIAATANIAVTGICMKPSQVRLIPNASFQPSFYATDTDGNEWPISSAINWQSSNSGVVGVNSAGVFSSNSNLGEATVTASWNGLNFQTKVKVVPDFKSPTAEKRVVRVAMVIIDPQIPAAGGQRFSEKFWAYNGGPMALAQQTRDSMFSVSGGTADYQFAETHWENDLSLMRFGGSQLTVDSFYRLFLEPGWPTLHLVAEQQGNAQFLYNDLLNKYDLCSKSNSKQIDEVWVWAMPFIGMYESNMTGTGAFWINGPVVSGNACTDLLPIMGFNYERYAGCALHNFTHRIELTMAKVFNTTYRYVPSDSPYPGGSPGNALQLFMNYDALEPGNAHIGNGHFPPNGIENYGYANHDFVPTHAPNWKRYPFLFDQTEPINCEAWGCEGDCGINFCSWWMRHIPHFKCADQTGRLNNWWPYIIDYNEGKALEAQADNCDCQLFDDTPPPPCASKGDFPWHEWIAGVKIGDLDNPSSKSQYSDFTSKTINLRQGTGNPWTFTVGYSYFTYDEYLRVWVDKNQNGIFEPSETVVEAVITRPPDGTPSKTINYCCSPVDFNEPLASGMRVRVAMKRGGYPDPCETIPFGEVEDYTMNIVAAPAKPDLWTGGWEYIPQWHPNGCGYAYIEPGGNAVSFAGVVINESPLAAAGPFKIKAWFSRDNNLSADDVLWKTTQYTGLDAKYGPHWNDGFSLSNTPVPLALPLGTYTVIVKIDADNEVDELDETNNIFLQEGVRIGWPDFTALVTSGVPTSVAPGGSFPLNFQIHNTNSFPVSQLASGGPVANVYLSTDNIFQSGTDVLLGSANLLYSQFNAFGEANGTANVTIPASTAPGNYSIFVVAADNCDPNTANNPSPPVSLQIGTAQPCTMTAQVSNVGCSANTATATVLVTAVNGGLQGWIGSYPTPGGPSFLTGQYGVPQTIGVWKDLTANSVGLNFFDPAVSGCTTTAQIVCPGQYCASKGDFPWEDWISSVSVGGAAANVSGKNQYSDFTATTFSLAKNTAANISLTTTYSYFTWDEYYRVWIDYNHDKTFDPATELAFAGILAKPAPGGNVSKTLTGQITVPATALDGPTRMRVSQKRGAYPGPCEVFPFGEVEDYTVNIGGGPSQQPDLTLTNLTMPASVAQGNVFNFNFDLKNIGNAAASGNFSIKSWLSTDQNLDASDYQNGSVPTGNIGAGVTVPQVLGAMSVAPTVAAGQYYLILKVDTDGQIAESNEANNVLVSAGKITVNPGGGTGADLELTLTADKTLVPIYSEVTFTVTARNTGTATVNTALVNVQICGLPGSGAFEQFSQLVYAGVPAAPTLGNYNFVTQIWEIPGLAPGQSAVLHLKLFTLGTATRTVAAWSAFQSPADPDSQPSGSIFANCTPAQDDEAIWIINGGQPRLQPGTRNWAEAEDFEVADFQIYPNPAGEQVAVQLENWAGRSATLTLVNQLGRPVLQQQLDEVPTSPTVIDLSEIPNGQYFLKMETPGRRTVVRKLAVARMY